MDIEHLTFIKFNSMNYNESKPPINLNRSRSIQWLSKYIILIIFELQLAFYIPIATLTDEILGLFDV